MELEVTLWNDLCGLLHTRGELPLRHEVMTPNEIAEAVLRTSGDRRSKRFVWDFYYPRHYGREPGTLSDDEARKLIESYASRQPEPPTPAEQAAIESERCGICHIRPARREG